MKDTGITRRIDELGRIVLPAELRRLFGIQAGDAIDIGVDGDAIVLRRAETACVFCNGVAGIRSYRGRYVCADCAASLGNVTPS